MSRGIYLTLTAAFLLFIPAASSYGQQAENETPLYRQLEIFPEEKIGNAVYLDRKWMFSSEEITIHDGLEIPAVDSLLMYVSINRQSGIYIYPKANIDRIEMLRRNLATFPLDNKKIFVYGAKNYKLAIFEFNFNSASGFVENDSNQLAFYHLAKIERDEFSLGTNYQYRLHVLDMDTNRLRTLPDVIEGEKQILAIAWENQAIKVNFGEELKETIIIPN